MKIKHIIFLLLLPSMLQGQHFSACPSLQHRDHMYENPLADKYLSDYDIGFYHLSLEISNLNTEIEGSAKIIARALVQMDTMVLQLIDELDVDHVEGEDGSKLLFEHTNDALFIPVAVEAGELFSISIFYGGDAGQNRGFFAGLSNAYDSENDQYVSYTLSEPLNARDWFPVKQVLADKADSVWVDLICDDDLMAGSVGRLVDVEQMNGSKHMFKWRSAYPIAYYLISFAVADYRDYSYYAELPGNTDSVLVQNFIYDDADYFSLWKERIDRAGTMITLFSELVSDYPFADEKYGHCVAPMGGGMEHQTMTTLSNFNFTLVAHELAHQWFGDNVTCGNWQDIWVNEGFASYFEYLALQNLNSQAAADDWMHYAQSLAFSEPEGSVFVPETEAEDVYRVFDYALSYKKGACLLHMIRYIIDDDQKFYDVLRTYQARYAKDVATAVDFRMVLDSITGIDFSCFFDQWYYGEGYPTFSILWTKTKDALHIQSLQETSSEQTPLFITPFELAIQGERGTEKIRLEQIQKEQTFHIPYTGRVDAVQFDPGRFLLAKSSVQYMLPEGTNYLLGPNPFRDSLLLKFRYDTGKKNVTVYSSAGKAVFQKAFFSSVFEIDLKELADGTYILTIEDAYSTIKEKIVKRSQP